MSQLIYSQLVPGLVNEHWVQKERVQFLFIEFREHHTHILRGRDSVQKFPSLFDYVLLHVGWLKREKERKQREKVSLFSSRLNFVEQFQVCGETQWKIYRVPTWSLSSHIHTSTASHDHRLCQGGHWLQSMSLNCRIIITHHCHSLHQCSLFVLYIYAFSQMCICIHYGSITEEFHSNIPLCCV